MDDSLNNAFGGQRVQTPVEEAWHNEQRRKMYDVYQVRFPVQVTVKGIAYDLPKEDFYLEYDTNQWQKISYGAVIQIPHYMAIRYVEKKKDDIVNFVVKKLHDEYLADRDKKGLPRYTDKHTENKETYETQDYPKTNDPDIVAEIYDQLWDGLVYKFGGDKLPANNNPRSGEVDLTPTSQKVLDSLKHKQVPQSDNPLGMHTVTPTAAPIPTVQPQLNRPSGFADLNKRLNPDE